MSKAKDVSASGGRPDTAKQAEQQKRTDREHESELSSAAVHTQQTVPAKPEDATAGAVPSGTQDTAFGRDQIAPTVVDDTEEDAPRRGRKLRAMSRMVHTHADGTEEVLEAGDTCSVNSFFAKLHPHMFELA